MHSCQLNKCKSYINNEFSVFHYLYFSQPKRAGCWTTFRINHKKPKRQVEKQHNYICTFRL